MKDQTWKELLAYYKLMTYLMGSWDMRSDNSNIGPLLECEEEHEEDASSTKSDEDVVDLFEEVEFPRELDVDGDDVGL